ncbi:hypothetical protein PX669_12035 [Acinetobacter soli]|nr:hypothetical protein PX669_12035 [Acinetobacter soli]
MSLLSRAGKTARTAFRYSFFVFEEGYVRPDYITFEANGVNHFSNFQYQLHQQSNSLDTIETHKTHNKFRRMVLSSIQYYIFWAVFFGFIHFISIIEAIHPYKRCATGLSLDTVGLKIML